MRSALEYEAPSLDVLVDEKRLQARVSKLGEDISADYRDNDLLLICILRGGVIFLTDLMRRVNIPHSIDFMAVESYGIGAREPSGMVRITMDLRTDIKDKHVLLVEDIVDTGHTLSSVLEMLRTRSPASLRVCCLLDKRDRREVVVPIDYVGFEIPDEYVFGYGLDLDELWRNLPYVAVIKGEEE